MWLLKIGNLFTAHQLCLVAFSGLSENNETGSDLTHILLEQIVCQTRILVVNTPYLDLAR